MRNTQIGKTGEKEDKLVWKEWCKGESNRAGEEKGMKTNKQKGKIKDERQRCRKERRNRREITSQGKENEDKENGKGKTDEEEKQTNGEGWKGGKEGRNQHKKERKRMNGVKKRQKWQQ